MAINYALKYADKVAERFRLGSLTDIATNKDYDFLGVKSVRVYSVDTVPLTDYTRSGPSRYGNPTELVDTYQELQLTRDRAFSFTIDAGNNMDQMMAKGAAKALKRQIDEVVLPEIDRYRLNIWAGGAGAVGLLASEPDSTTIVKSISDGAVALDNALVPSEGRTIFLPATYYNLLRQSNQFLGLEKLGAKALCKGVVGEIDGMRVVKIPDFYMPVGGYFIITCADSLVAPVKLQEYKTHKDPPGINGALVEGRVYYDAFVLGSKARGIYAAAAASAACAAPSFTPVSGGAVTPGTTTIALSCATSGAAIRYTLDGSEPKTSPTAAVYSGAIPTAGWTGRCTVRAYASKAGCLNSGISTAVYEL